MLRITGTFEERGGRSVVDLGDPTHWDTLPGEMQYDTAILLFGDAEAGPYLSMVHVPPRTEALERFPSHRHPSDTWRCAIQGTLSMAARSYGPGEFRFQQGHVPYGSDDFAWGPDGGKSVVLMADRRGTALVPSDKEQEAFWTEAGNAFADWLGVPHPVDPGEPPGVVTSIGEPARGGRVEGSFDDTQAWDPVEPGVRAAAGTLGRADLGPVVVLARAEAGATAFPAWPLDTEVVHLVVAGSVTLGGDVARRGEIRAARAGAPPVPLVAGPEGAAVATIVGDRRALAAAADAGAWSALVGRVVATAREAVPAASA